MPLPVIFDSDPGHDDALAHLLALESPQLEVLGITTVTGNAPVERVTENALRFLTLIGHPHVPVVAGASANLSGVKNTAEYVHGESGLDGAALPQARGRALDVDAVEFQVELIDRAAEPVTLIPTGPLTNVARLLQRHPRVGERIAGIALMGGSVTEGNKTPSAEFNIWADPEAAAIVFGSGLPVTMIGLNVSHQVQVRYSDLDRLRVGTGAVATTIASLLDFFIGWHRRTYGWDGSPLHDALPVAHLIDASLIGTQTLAVDVEVSGELTRGRTVVDIRGQAESVGHPCRVAMTVDAPRVVDLVLDAVLSCDRRLQLAASS